MRLVALALSLLLWTPAAAQTGEAPGRLHVSAEAGLLVPSFFGALDPALVVSVEAGLRFSPRLGLFGEASFAEPSASGTGQNPDLEGGAFRFVTRQRELALTAGLMGWLPLSGAWSGWLALGPRLYVLDTGAQAEAGGAPLPARGERSVQVGGAARLGLERRAGHGAFTLSVGFGASPLPHDSTGATTTAALSVGAGYRLFF